MIQTIQHIIQRIPRALVLAILVFEFVFPHYGLAAEITPIQSVLLPNMAIKGAVSLEPENTTIRLIMPSYQPESGIQAVQTYRITVTSYSSTVDQTDSTPCITANGFDLCENNQENVIAANFLPFNTKVRIPELFGDRIFTVQDRMNARYYYRADVWFKNRTEAIKFGANYTTIEVVE